MFSYSIAPLFRTSPWRFASFRGNTGGRWEATRTSAALTRLTGCSPTNILPKNTSLRAANGLPWERKSSAGGGGPRPRTLRDPREKGRGAGGGREERAGGG